MIETTTGDILWNHNFEREEDVIELREVDEDIIDYSLLFEKFGDYFRPSNL